MVPTVYIIVRHEYYSGGVSTHYLGYTTRSFEAAEVLQREQKRMQERKANFYDSSFEYEIIEVDPV